MMLASVVVFTGCGGNRMNGGTDELVGDWNWDVTNTLYYTFNADGTGVRDGAAIHWSTNNGVLRICWTPGMCGNSCIAPEEWNYSISGDTLNIDSRQVPGIAWGYIRAN